VNVCALRDTELEANRSLSETLAISIDYCHDYTRDERIGNDEDDRAVPGPR
jgi:hypothetical protein